MRTSLAIDSNGWPILLDAGAATRQPDPRQWGDMTLAQAVSGLYREQLEAAVGAGRVRTREHEQQTLYHLTDCYAARPAHKKAKDRPQVRQEFERRLAASPNRTAQSSQPRRGVRVDLADHPRVTLSGNCSVEQRTRDASDFLHGDRGAQQQRRRLSLSNDAPATHFQRRLRDAREALGTQERRQSHPPAQLERELSRFKPTDGHEWFSVEECAVAMQILSSTDEPLSGEQRRNLKAELVGHTTPRSNPTTGALEFKASEVLELAGPRIHATLVSDSLNCRSYPCR